jgi:hypothetical protein
MEPRGSWPRPSSKILIWSVDPGLTVWPWRQCFSSPDRAWVFLRWLQWFWRLSCVVSVIHQQQVSSQHITDSSHRQFKCGKVVEICLQILFLYIWCFYVSYSHKKHIETLHKAHIKHLDVCYGKFCKWFISLAINKTRKRWRGASSTHVRNEEFIQYFGWKTWRKEATRKN